MCRCNEIAYYALEDYLIAHWRTYLSCIKGVTYYALEGLFIVHFIYFMCIGGFAYNALEDLLIVDWRVFFPGILTENFTHSLIYLSLFSYKYLNYDP